MTGKTVQMMVVYSGTDEDHDTLAAGKSGTQRWNVSYSESCIFSFGKFYLVHVLYERTWT